MHETLVRKYWDILMGGDPSGLDEVADPNLKMSIAGVPLPPGVTLPIRAALLRQAIPDATTTYEILQSGKDGVTLEWKTEGTHLGPFILRGLNLPASGHRVGYTGLAFLRVADGRVVEERAYPDVETMLQQMKAK
ncbi:MAG: ester cyclase [Dehalococcoidia bacterium]